MEISKYELAKDGDRVHFIVNVPMTKDEERGYTHNVNYDGIVVKHSGYTTEIEFIGDDKKHHTVTVYNYGQSSGYESFELLVDDNELDKRRLEWIERVIDEETEKFNKRLEQIKNISIR